MSRSNRREAGSPMHYLDALRGLHARLRPSSYLEIGVQTGKSLALARCPSIGVDPAFEVKFELRGQISLERTTSDLFFSRDEPIRWLGNRVDLGFIDGMHLFEFALRDFINLEKHCTWSSVIVFDDVSPRNASEAARERHTSAWTGDVFRMVRTLRRYRPDLTLLLLDTEPTGLLLVTGLDPKSTVLERAYDEIVRNTVKPDPQPVPRAVIERKHSRDPEAVLRHPLWDLLRRSRRLPISPDRGRKLIQKVLADPRGYRRRRRALRRMAARAAWFGRSR